MMVPLKGTKEDVVDENKNKAVEAEADHPKLSRKKTELRCSYPLLEDLFLVFFQESVSSIQKMSTFEISYKKLTIG